METSLKNKILVVPSWYPCSFFKEQADLLCPDYDVKILSGVMHQLRFREVLIKRKWCKCAVVQNDDYTLVDFYYLRDARSFCFTKQIEYLTEKIGKIILDLFDGTKPNVIHIQSISDIAVFITRWAKKHNIKVLLTEHILFIRHEINRFSILRENVYNEVDEVLCVSNYLYRNLLTSGFKMKCVSAIGNLVNDKYVEGYSCAKKNGRVLFVANHYHDKGLDVLFEVVQQLHTRTDCIIDVIGLDINSLFNAKSTIGEMIEKYHIEDNVCLLGKMQHDDLLKLYSKYSVLVSTSTSETFGLAVAEAIMYGTKVVCTDSGGVRDIVTEGTGIVVGINDVVGLVDAIIKTLESPEVHEGASYVLRERYGSKQYRDKLLASYNQ